MAYKYFDDSKKITEATEIYKSLEDSWTKKEYEFLIKLEEYVVSVLQEASPDASNHNCNLIERNENIDDILKKIKEIRFGNCPHGNNTNHFGTVFKKNLNGYTIYFLFDYINGSESSWIGIRVSDLKNKLLSSSDIIDFIGGDLELTERDSFLIYKFIGDPVFASRENILGTVGLFDNDCFFDLVKRVGDDIVKLITSVH